MTDLLCFGSCVLDLYADGQKPAVGGDAANQAILLSKLGFSTACSARLGQDQEADLILAQLQAHNVKIDWPACRRDHNTFPDSAGRAG